jgi:hypothetical protein
MAKQRFNETVNIRQINPSTGFSAANNSLLNRLNQFSQQATAVAKDVSAKRGVEEAEKAISEGKPFEKRKAGKVESFLTGGISTESYNKTLETAYLAGLGNDTKERISAIEAENQDNVLSFNEKVNGYTKGVLSSVDPSVKNQVSQFLDSQITNSRMRVHRKNILKNKADAIAESSQAVTAFGNDAASLAREGNSTAAAESALQAFTTIDGLVSSGDLATDKATNIKREINREMTEQVSRKKFDDIIKTDGPLEAEKELNKIKGKAPKGWTPDEWDSYTNSQQTDINREISKLKSRSQEVSKEAQIALRQYESAVSLGFEVDAQEKIRVKNLVGGTDQQAQFDRINKTASFSVMSNTDRIAMLNDAESGQLDDVADFSSMLKANQQINKAARTDGYALGTKQGLIEPVVFDPADPESMKIRAQQADTLSNHYGVPVSPLTDGEANGLSSQIDTMTVGEKVQLATTLNQAPAVWGQISEKNQPAFSMAGATGDIPFMSAVFKGQELLANKLVTAPKSADYLPVLDDFVGDVYGVQDKKAILEAAKNHYVATADDGGEFDSSAFEESLMATTGGIAEVNGFKVELPRGTDEDTFDEFIDEFTPQQVNVMGGVLGFTDEEAALLIQDARLKNVGANKYIAMANENQALFKPDGTPLIIEWSEQATADIQATRLIESRRSISESIDSLRSF